MAIDRIDRKELQHDAFRDAAFAFIDYIYQRRLRFILGGIALVVIVAGAVGGLATILLVWWWRWRRERTGEA